MPQITGHAPDPIDDLVDRARRLGATQEPLGTLLAAMRDDAALTVATPGAALASVLEDGIPASELAAAAGASGRAPWRRWATVAARVLVTKFAALGLLAKAATAGAAVTIAASGAGAAGVLPAPAQEAFDQVVGRDGPDGGDQATDDPVDGSTLESPTDDDRSTDVLEPADDATNGDLVDDSPSDDEPDSFGERVSGDATGETDGVPGVDGREVASEASDGRSEQRGSSSEARERAETRRGDDAEGDDEGDDDLSQDGDVDDESTASESSDGDAHSGDADGGDADGGDPDGGDADGGDTVGRGRGVGPPPGAPAVGRGG